MPPSEDAPAWRKPAKLVFAQPLRCTATLVLGLIFLHLLLTHKDVARKSSAAPLTLPAERPMALQVEVLDSCPEDMPLLEERQEVLQPDELKALKARLFNSTWLTPLGRRAGRLGARGVAVTLNTGGIEKLERDPRLADLAAFFARERLATANAWHMSLVALESCAGFKADRGVWEAHQEQLAASGGREFEAPGRAVHILPHSSTLFHAHVPAGLNGGALWLWTDNDTANAAPSAIVAPRENAQVTFRGDVLTGTSGQNASEPGAPVVTLVLHQYKVPTALYAQTADFRVASVFSEYRAKRPDPLAYRAFTEEQAAAAAAALAELPPQSRRRLTANQESRRRGGKAAVGF